MHALLRKVDTLRVSLLACFLLLAVAAVSPAAGAAPGEASPLARTGVPLLADHTPTEIAGLSQSWDVAQAPDGLVYVANMAGVLEFDGVRWRKIPLTGDAAYSVDTAPDGTVYAGGQGTFGRLDPDSTGLAYLFDPATGEEYPLGQAAPDADGTWTPEDARPLFQDKVLVVEEKS